MGGFQGCEHRINFGYCPYCEIERLQKELAEVKAKLPRYESATKVEAKKYRKVVEALERSE